MNPIVKFVVALIVLAYMAFIAWAIWPDPPAPALEEWLLTAEEAGAGYTETYRGTAAGSGGDNSCPGFLGTRASLVVDRPREHGAVRVEFVGPESGKVVLSEVLWVVRTDRVGDFGSDMDNVFADLERDHWECRDENMWVGGDGWETFALVSPPDLGDDSLAGLHRVEGEGSTREEWIVVIRHGDVLAEFTLVEEVFEDNFFSPRPQKPIIDEEFYAIISAALDKLPD